MIIPKKHPSPSSSNHYSKDNQQNKRLKIMNSQCPYAVALSEDERSLQSQQQQQQQSSPNSTRALLELRQCPAFATASKCPFKEAKSAEAIQETLAQIPKSHYTEHQSGFYQVMEHFHQVQQTGKGVQLPSGGQCPMQPYMSEGGASKKKSFARTMEECSMAAIMARLASDMEGEESNSDGKMSPRHSETSLLVPPVEQLEQQPDDTQEEEEPRRNSLAEALKTGTAVSHQAAEDVHFVRNFIRGQIDRHLYQEMILGLYHVYVALEETLDRHAPAMFPSCHFPQELSRKESLQEDCEFWHNTRTPSPRTISAATQDYIDRIQYLAHHDPLLLLAHSYTRYLGDLSGGRILARVARRALDLDKQSGDGLAFYRFEKVESYKAFKDNYRQSLDALPLTSEQIQSLVAEANVAFCLNMRLFQELDVMATIPGAEVMSMEQVMEYAHKKGTLSDSDNKAQEQCPFLVNKKKEQQQQSAGAVMKKGARCPWPFVVAHDPWQFAKDWQTWLLVALMVTWWYRW
ncbi:Heme oxygenase 1 [Seminavis robusta]|uniref:Heme oxygenase 1 n=1 Tax=Seminavis robusta TaxID=568900 RepID=A0A9N8EQV7_9STRA|nr:Heme oxygenase 1 [Seminavis robusta]|eukprot:Sro1702_g292240.1 Heme oxygenase 1 (518) ;mRNA; r:13534-15087